MTKRIAAFLPPVSLPFLLLFAVAAPGRPQDPAPNKERPRKVFPKEQESDDVVRIDTDLVSVDLRALDAKGRPVRNLRQEDFKIFSDGVELPISFFQLEKRPGEPRPLAIVFAVRSEERRVGKECRSR